MRFPFQKAATAVQFRQPTPSPIPEIPGAEIAAVYHGTRVAGDFYDMIALGDNRFLFLMIDVAGEKESGQAIAATVQDEFRARAPELFRSEDINEAEAVSDLTLHLNRVILDSAGGVRCTPAFVASYNETLGVVFYCNAGHTPATLRDSAGTWELGATGLPLGLFSHAIHDAQVSTLEQGAALVLVSKGLIESRAGRKEFGFDRVKQVVEAAKRDSAQELCAQVMEAVYRFTGKPPRHDDVTTLALLRAAQKTAASVSL
jgi:sigma-B regulation protein RsbU (phosphoserine phosphatase)